MTAISDGKISKQLLKTRSGEFDVESIHSLFLRDAEGLQSLEKLHTLSLSGNHIARFESLVCLTGLEYLQDLRLQDRINKLSNPVCQHVNYLEEVQRMFPRLKTLDGERVQGKGSELYQLCRQIDTQLQQEPIASASLQAQRPAPWLQSQYWEMADDFQNSMLCDAEVQLTGSSCCYPLSTFAMNVSLSGRGDGAKFKPLESTAVVTADVPAAEIDNSFLEVIITCLAFGDRSVGQEAVELGYVDLLGGCIEVAVGLGLQLSGSSGVALVDGLWYQR
ncbi:leucine-rich repeat-containing protein 61-like isoform X2 [Haliotis rubra]|uniref:leucine-rich repeat-containing protein 61-like isoform X2 n=1 Tax=Haliotis rubra TaxID=36100 RepID=UPI001EE5AF60|nr:leucine-rich repeat-containing protein 61-like isoform X2 [Haliotis rubra]